MCYDAVYPPPESGARVSRVWIRAQGRWNIIPFGQKDHLLKPLVTLVTSKILLSYLEDHPMTCKMVNNNGYPKSPK